MKVLITSPCAVPSMDGPQHLDANSFAELETKSARGVIAAGRGLYVDPKDDPSKTKAYTAPKDLIKTVSDALAPPAKSKAGAGAAAAEA